MGSDLGLRMNTRVYGRKGVYGVTDTPFQKSQEFLQMVCLVLPLDLDDTFFLNGQPDRSLKTEGTPIYRPHQDAYGQRQRSLTSLQHR